MKNLYIIKSVNTKLHLLAALSQSDNGYYEFKPLIPSADLTSELSFPLLKKAIDSGVNPLQNEIKDWIRQFTPPLDDKDLVDRLLKKKGLAEYNEWEWLKTYKPNSMNNLGFYEEIPEDCIRHNQDRNAEDDEDDEEDEDEFSEPNFADDDFKYRFRSKMEAFLYDNIGKSTEKPEDRKPAAPPVKKRISADEFISEHSFCLIIDKYVIEQVYKDLAQTTLSSYCSVMKNPRVTISKLQNSLGCSAEEKQDICADKLQLPELINKFVEKSGFGNADSKQYRDTTAAVYDALITPYLSNNKTQKG